MEPESYNNLFEAADAGAQIVATITGLKQQFVDAGWSDAGAEAMVLEILKKG